MGETGVLCYIPQVFTVGTYRTTNILVNCFRKAKVEMEMERGWQDIERGILATRDGKRCSSQGSNNKEKLRVNASTALADGCGGARTATAGGGTEVVERANRRRRDSRRKMVAAVLCFGGMKDGDDREREGGRNVLWRPILF